jgi:hypothetical protein
MSSKFKFLTTVLLLLTLLGVTVFSVLRLTQTIDAQQVTRSAILQESLNRAIQFGLQVDPLRSEPYLTQTIETTYLKWSMW